MAQQPFFDEGKELYTKIDSPEFKPMSQSMMMPQLSVSQPPMQVQRKPSPQILLNTSAQAVGTQRQIVPNTGAPQQVQ